VGCNAPCRLPYRPRLPITIRCGAIRTPPSSSRRRWYCRPISRSLRVR
jgi:hypothetical protein